MLKARRGAESISENETIIRNQNQSCLRAVMQGHQGS